LAHVLLVVPTNNGLPYCAHFSGVGYPSQGPHDKRVSPKHPLRECIPHGGVKFQCGIDGLSPRWTTCPWKSGQFLKGFLGNRPKGQPPFWERRLLVTPQARDFPSFFEFKTGSTTIKHFLSFGTGFEILEGATLRRISDYRDVKACSPAHLNRHQPRVVCLGQKAQTTCGSGSLTEPSNWIQ